MRYPQCLALPFALLLLVPGAQAQVASAPGSRVRISSPELPAGQAIGVLERVTGDSVIVSGLAVSRSSIAQFEVSTGRKSHLLMGVGIGLASGAVVGGVVCRLKCLGRHDSDYNGMATAIGAGAGGVLGLVIGAVVGAKKSEQWRRSSLSALRISPMVGSNGSLGLSVGFQF